ncbi:MAG TPA: DUF1127 domain-containing protein [Kiloniellales bacterium]
MLIYLEVAGLSHVYDQRPVRHYAGAAARPTGERFASALKRRVGRTWAAIARARERRATVRSLSALDDRALADIGVYRGQIPAVAAAAVDGHDPRRGTELSGHRQVRSNVAAGQAAANDNAAEIAA